MSFSYEQAVGVLESALKFGINPSLEPIACMCRELGNPQSAFRSIQVAGSNGKTSTTRITAALLRAAGLRVGLYTSPHLVAYPERMEIDGKVVSDAAFARAVEAAVNAAEACGLKATEFELLTAAALWLFAQEGVQWAVLECGLGGRWDATSVVAPEVAVITGVALEHTAILGDTLEKIAAEKAAIIKPGCVAVLAHDVAAREVFEEQAAQVQVRLVSAQPDSAARFKSAMAHLPSYQQANASTALTAVREALGHDLPDADASRALAALAVPGRFERLRTDPLLIVDAAHNPQSAQTLAREVKARFNGQERSGLTLLLGVLADKDAEGVIEALCPLFNRVVVTASSSPRALPPEELAARVKAVTGTCPDVRASVQDALAACEGTPTVASGSITIAGEVKRLVAGHA